MPKLSAGLLVCRRGDDGLEVLLVHPGGPYWARKDDGAWSIPKGEYEAGRGSARSRVAGVPRGDGEGAAGSRGRRVARASCVCRAGRSLAPGRWRETSTSATCRATRSRWSGLLGSGRTQEFPEVDRAGWFGIEEARTKLLAVRSDSSTDSPSCVTGEPCESALGSRFPQSHHVAFRVLEVRVRSQPGDLRPRLHDRRPRRPRPS